MLTRWRYKRLINSFTKGKWNRFMSRDQCNEWERFVRRASFTPYRETVVMRITIGAEEKWYLWLVYKFCGESGRSHLHLQKMYAPSNENDRFTTPEEIADDPYFEVAA